MLPGFRVRFPAGAIIYVGTIASTRPVVSGRIEFAFADQFRWTFLKSHLFYRDWRDDEADAHGEAEEDEPKEFVADELAPVPA